jgi:hypothetical protein
MSSARAIASVCLLSAAASMVSPGSSAADLVGRYQAGQQRASQLRSRIGGETHRIQWFEGSISSLQARLNVIQSSVAVQEQLLNSVSEQLSQARVRLGLLRADYARDRQTLASELRSEYETPAPTIVNVVVDSGGFNDLVNGLRNLTAIEHTNVIATKAVVSTRDAVRSESIRLAKVQARRRRATAAVVVERDDVAQLRVSIVDRELSVEWARSADTGRLTALHRTLAHEANVLDAQAARARSFSSAASGGVAPPGGCVNTPFVAHGGSYGFFQSPGTNYSVNEEPVLAGRLDALGKALQLHLIGVSGYRTPQHSVEVGGFADDPHTRGIASDTPGVEGVPESTLEQFCLTRPFGGAREADHIQES